MATQPERKLDRVTTVVRTAVATVAEGRIVKDGSNDGECQHAGAGETGFGVVLSIGGNPSVTAGATNDRITIALLAGAGVVPVKVGTGGATRGKWAKGVSDGVTDATPIAGAGTLKAVYGQFTQNGSAGDVVGMIPIPGFVTEA